MTAPRRQLRLATYNIHACVGIDGKCLPSRIAAVIAELSADVVGLQEVGIGGRPDDPAEQLGRISRMTGYEYLAAPTFDLPSGPFGNALLTRLPVREVHRGDLSVPRFEPRGLLDIVLDWAGAPLRVLVTHLGLSRRERSWQLARIFDRLAETPAERTVLMGDFNEWIFWSPRLLRLHARFGRSHARASFPSWRPLVALDRFWVAPRGLRRATGVHASRLARLASDHLPAWTVIEAPVSTEAAPARPRAADPLAQARTPSRG